MEYKLTGHGMSSELHIYCVESQPFHDMDSNSSWVRYEAMLNYVNNIVVDGS